ncbi:MAG: helix-hairpin-helix domain-containing protein [Bacteroidales bacterium]|nr:helix-hairpin-helix domain-containing protein [Bacteroidales bacterium]
MQEGKNTGKKEKTSLPGSFTVGAVALVFLIIGYQAAVFIHHAATVKLAANRDRPDTVYVVDSALAESLVKQAGLPEEGPVVVRKNAKRSEYAVAARDKAVPRRVESFRFNPNTISIEDLQRLGFSEKQAQAIDNYRLKGGRFRRPADFAKSYVVADSVYKRLEQYIEIPKLDLNKADSTALLDLPGIGPWFAGRIVSYRESLYGYSSIDQLLDIKNFSEERLQGIRDLVVLSKPGPYPLWTLPEEELKKHPYISNAEAHGIVLYREHNKKEALSVEGLLRAGVISEQHARKLEGCAIESPGA